MTLTAPVDAERRRRALLTNTGALVAARAIVAGLGWVGTLIIVRRLTVAEFGRFTFVFSLLALVSVFTELGLGRVAIAGLLDETRDRATFAGTLVLLRTVLALVTYAAAMAFVVVAGYPAEVVRATAVAGVVVILATVSHAIEAIFQVNLRMATVAVSTIAGQVTQLALIAAVAAGGGSVVVFAMPAVACEVVILVWRVRTVRSLQRLRLRVDWPAWRSLLKESAPLSAGVLLTAFAYRVDAVMLSRLDTFAAVGVYGVAYKFVDVVQFLPSALMIPVLALLVRAWPDDPAAFAQTFRRAFTMLAAGAVIVAVEFAVFSRSIIDLLYGGQYSVGARAAALVVAAECMAGFSVLAFTCLVAMGRHLLYPAAALIGLVANVALNLWLIPSWSYDGAALATVVTQLLVIAVLWTPVARMPALRPVPVRSLAVSVGAGVAAAVVALFSRTVLPWPLAAVASLLFYGAVLWLTGLHRVVSTGSRLAPGLAPCGEGDGDGR